MREITVEGNEGKEGQDKDLFGEIIAKLELGSLIDGSLVDRAVAKNKATNGGLLDGLWGVYKISKTLDGEGVEAVLRRASLFGLIEKIQESEKWET